ncbi:MAG: thiamine phosphate synthase, partial [Pseudomonadota bacterium]
QTKDVDHFAEPELLGWWSKMFELPCVAIGGITLDNVVPLVAAGVDFIAVSAAVWNSQGGESAAVRSFYDIFQGYNQK